MLQFPDTDQQRQFLKMFFRLANGSDYIKEIELLDVYSDMEIKEAAISIIPYFTEMGWSEIRVNEALTAENLPEFAAFKKLSSTYLSKILKKKTITSGDDMLLIQDALSANLLSGAELAKAQAFIKSLGL